MISSSYEFTPRQILFLLAPSWMAVRNARRKAGRGDWLRVALFGSVTLVFASFIFFGFYSMITKLAHVLGPSLVGVVALLSEEPKAILLAVLPLFVLGGLILSSVRRPEGESQK